MEDGYRPISDKEEEHVTAESSLLTYKLKALLPVFQERQSTSRSNGKLIWLLHGLLLSISSTFFTLSIYNLHKRPSDLYFTQHYSAYSPAAPSVEYKSTRYNVTPVLEQTDFVGYGPEVDAAWNHITYDVGDQMINREELEKLGLPTDSLQIEDPKTGEKGYRVGVQVFHQLHCLNLLRQDSYKEYYSHNHKGGDIEVEPEDLRGHLDHCIEILRTALMCHSDIGVFPFRYYEGMEGHWPDFSTLHTCRNFDGIRKWAFENAVVFGDEE